MESAEIQELCACIGLDLEVFRDECADHLRQRLWDLATPNADWFKKGYNINRYWRYLEQVSGHKWEYSEVNEFYKHVRQRAKEREEVGATLRYTVLERDHFTCQCCGRQAPEAELEIDHKHPWAYGGPTVLDNLQTLCTACNRGKKARVSSKLRQGGIQDDKR